MSWLTMRHEGIHRRFLSAIVALGGLLWFARVGWACSCGGLWEPKDADVIFRGTAVEVHQPLHLRIMPRSRRGVAGNAWAIWAVASKTFDADVRTVFRVEEAWKGEPAEYVSLNTGSGRCCDCSLGRRFTVGSDYVVYAVRWHGELLVDSCAGNVTDTSSASLLELASLGLGKGKAPSSGGRHVPMFWRHLLLPTAIALPILLTTIVWLLRAKRRHGHASFRPSGGP